MTNTREQGTGNREQELRNLRDKVIRGLKCCAEDYGRCKNLDCPYEGDCTIISDCVKELTDDAIALIDELSAEGLWVYCPDDEGRPRWKCSRCGKIVHKDPAEKLFCAACGQRNRKEA